MPCGTFPFPFLFYLLPTSSVQTSSVQSTTVQLSSVQSTTVQSLSVQTQFYDHPPWNYLPCIHPLHNHHLQSLHGIFISEIVAGEDDSDPIAPSNSERRSQDVDCSVALQSQATDNSDNNIDNYSLLIIIVYCPDLAQLVHIIAPKRRIAVQEQFNIFF